MASRALIIAIENYPRVVDFATVLPGTHDSAKKFLEWVKGSKKFAKIPAGEESNTDNPFAAVAHFVLAVRTAGTSLIVVKTAVGTAQSVAVAIDQSNWPEVVGTISGDDTIFIATDDGRAQRKLRERLRGIFGV